MTDLLTAADDNDILLWPDHFWCFRDELPAHFLRTRYFRAIPAHCLEWHHFTYELAVRVQKALMDTETTFKALAEGLSKLKLLEKRIVDLKLSAVAFKKRREDDSKK